MTHLDQLQRAIDYIEEHLHEDLSVDAIAKVAGFSKWHFQMIFSSAIGDSLKEYVRKRRLTAALIELGTTNKRILDITLDAGFESQEAFTRAFKAMFQRTPGECRKHGTQSVMYLHKPRITVEYLDHLYEGINMQPIMMRLKEKTVVGMETRFISALSPDHNNHILIPALWEKYGARRNEIAERISQKDMGVILCLGDESNKSHPNEMRYLACTEVKNNERIPQGMVSLAIPAGNYAMFTHKGLISKIGMTMKYIYGSWLPKSGKRLRDAPELELYDERFHANSEDSELEVYIPIE